MLFNGRMFYVIQIFFSNALAEYFGFENFPAEKPPAPVFNFSCMYIVAWYWSYTYNVPFVHKHVVSNSLANLCVYSSLVDKGPLALVPLPARKPFTVCWKDMAKMVNMREVMFSILTPTGRAPLYHGGLFMRIGVRPKAIVKAVSKPITLVTWAVGTDRSPNGEVRFDLNSARLSGIGPNVALCRCRQH